MKNKGLGKGLSALLGDSNDVVDLKKFDKFNTNLTPIHLLKPNQFQPRKKFNQEKLNDLATSIRARGIIQPIAVRKDKDGKFEIIAGERRWRAAQLARVHEVPTVILQADDGLTAEFALLENVQREDLNAIEEANGFDLLIEKFGYTQEKLSEMIGKSRVYITNTLRLKKLPQKIKDLVISGSLTAGHARSLIDADNNVKLASVIIKKKLTVRQTENLVKSTKRKKIPGNKSKDSNILDLQDKISLKTGMSVNITNSKSNRGVISFKYKSLDQLERLVKIIKSNF
tara:strand:- start:152 stop:1006 length:855 start_codon:yes stop_codon:yes gene_type:complete